MGLWNGMEKRLMIGQRKKENQQNSNGKIYWLGLYMYIVSLQYDMNGKTNSVFINQPPELRLKSPDPRGRVLFTQDYVSKLKRTWKKNEKTDLVESLF